MEKKRAQWSSKLGFILAAAGSAGEEDIRGLSRRHKAETCDFRYILAVDRLIRVLDDL